MNRRGAPGEAVVFHTLRVRYCETDQMGIAWHGHHVAWFEAARVEWLRANGYSYAELEKKGFWLPVLRLSCDYRKSACFDDELSIRTYISHYNGVRIGFVYEILPLQEGSILAQGATDHVFTNTAMRPVRVDRAEPDLHALLFGALGEQ